MGMASLAARRAPASPPTTRPRWRCRSPSRLVRRAAGRAVSPRRSAKVRRKQAGVRHREHAKLWGAHEVRLNSGLTRRGWAGAETGVAGGGGVGGWGTGGGGGGKWPGGGGGGGRVGRGWGLGLCGGGGPRGAPRPRRGGP